VPTKIFNVSRCVSVRLPTGSTDRRCARYPFQSNGDLKIPTIMYYDSQGRMTGFFSLFFAAALSDISIAAGAEALELKSKIVDSGDLSNYIFVEW
jgi:hypothetical protein